MDQLKSPQALSTVLEINLENYLAPSLNELIRMHWAERKKAQTSLTWMLKAQLPANLSEVFKKDHQGPVKLHYIRYSSQKMDTDNLYGSFKLIGDALKGLGVYKDDSPDHLVLRASQVLTREKKTKLIIEI